MSKLCMIRRELRRTVLVKKYEAKRSELRLIKNDPSVDLEAKLAASKALQMLPKDSAKCRQRRRCWKTGRGHGVYRAVGMCRNMFRIHAMQGDIPGIHKASW
jgi:small subunit ribosomal protein S14